MKNILIGASILIVGVQNTFAFDPEYLKEVVTSDAYEKVTNEAISNGYSVFREIKTIEAE